MKLMRIAVLPSLVTLGNAVCGLVAVALLMKDEPAYAAAGYVIFLGMIFDALDGRVARFARVTSDFGGQLDSLSDGITFGAAPALLAHRLFMSEIGNPAFQRLTLALAAVYMGCALLRLARFNVENVHDEEAHMVFRGLPSPAAAGALVSLVILVSSFRAQGIMPEVARGIIWALPGAMLVLGLLMVSNVHYSHLLNQLVRGRRPLSHIVQIILVIALLAFLQERAIAPIFVVYALSGPGKWLWSRLASLGRKRSSAGQQQAEDQPPQA